MKNKIRDLLTRKPELRNSRGEFMWAWIEDKFGVCVGISKRQFLEFWLNEATLERSLRDVLKEDGFSPSTEANKGRYSKANEMREEYKDHREVETKKDDWFLKSLQGKEKKDFNNTFNT